MIRVFDFMHIQLSILVLVWLLVYWLQYENFNFWEISFMVLLGCSAAFLGYVMLPYTAVYSCEVADADRDAREKDKITLMACNVLQYNKHYNKCLEVINKVDPDLLLMVETDQKWQDALVPLESKYQYHVHYPQNNTYGILLYSKLKLENSKVKFLIEDDVPSIHTNVTLRNGKVVKFFGIHPKPPSPSENESSLERDAELIVVGKMAKKLDMPVIVAGDLNDVAWSYTTNLFQKVSGLLDPRIGRGFFNTFHANYFFFRWPLDHVFHSRHFKLCDLCVLPHIGSDHFPICITLVYTDNVEENEKVPEADKQEQEDAKEKLEEV